MTLPPLPEPIHMGVKEVYWNEFIPVTGYTAAQMESYARAAIAAHVPEAAFGNIAAVPAQPVAWMTTRKKDGTKTLTQGEAATNPEYVHMYKDWEWTPLYAAPQAVPVPAGWSVTYDGKRASYIYADQETAEFEAQQVGGTARAVAVYLAAAPKEQP